MFLQELQQIQFEGTCFHMFSVLKKPLSSLFFCFPILLPLGLGFVPVSVYSQEVLGMQMRSEGMDYCFPLSSVVVVPHEDSCGAGWVGPEYVLSGNCYISHA